MAEKPFSREVWNLRERPLSSDLNQGMSYLDRTVRDLISALSFTFDGFLGDSFYVTATGNALEVQIAAGMGMRLDGSMAATNIGSVGGVNDASNFVPVVLTAPQVITLAAAPAAGLERYDLIEVRVNRRLTDSANRDVLNIGTGVFDSTTVNKTLAYDLDAQVGTVASPSASTAPISVKRGVEAAIGAAALPSGTTGYTPLAYVHVENGASDLTSEVTDERLIMTLGSAGFLAGYVGVIYDNPNAIDAANSSSLPASIRVGAKLLDSGAVISRVTMYCIYGDMGNGHNIQARPYVINSGAVKDLVISVHEDGNGVVDASLRSDLIGQIPTLAVGQKYFYQTIQAKSLAGSALTNGNLLGYRWLVSLT